MPDVSERGFEEAIEAALLAGGPDAPGSPAAGKEARTGYTEMLPGGYRRRKPEDYEPALCLVPRDVLDFVYATQPKEWERLKQHHGTEVKEKFLKRVSREIEQRGADLERLYVFARPLRRYLPSTIERLPVEIQDDIDMESYRVQHAGTRKIELERGPGKVEPIGAAAVFGPPVEQLEPLSQIIRELNERFGTDFTEEERVFIQHLQSQLSADEALVTAVRTNVPENARLTFDHVVGDRLQDMVDTNFKFYKRVTDDREFAKYFLDWLFDKFRDQVEVPRGERRE